MFSFIVLNYSHKRKWQHLKYNKMTCEHVEDHKIFLKFKFMKNKHIINVHVKLQLI
jgi:hypothetical protein